jgi:hypothetical protein
VKPVGKAFSIVGRDDTLPSTPLFFGDGEIDDHKYDKQSGNAGAGGNALP